MAVKISTGNLGSLFSGSWKQKASLNKYFHCMVREFLIIDELLCFLFEYKMGFMISDEQKKKEMLRSWALNFWDVTRQPIDDIYLYFGAKAS